MKATTILFFLVISLSSGLPAFPNFSVKQDGQSLFIYFKQRELGQSVIDRIRVLFPKRKGETDIEVHSQSGSFVQMFNFLDRFRKPSELFPYELEFELEEKIFGVPYVLSEKKLAARRAALMQKIMQVARDPQQFTFEDIQGLANEKVLLPLLSAQRWVLEKQQPLGRRATEQEAALIKAEFDKIDALKQQGVRVARERALRAALHTLTEEDDYTNEDGF